MMTVSGILRMTAVCALGVVVCVTGLRAESDKPKAKRFYERGMAAVDLQQWELAIKNFNDARQLDLQEPRYVFALAMAHDKAEHHLAGAAWLHVYLALDPKSEKKEAVEREIAKLEEATGENIRKIFAVAASAAHQLPSEEARVERLAVLAVVQAQVGRIDDALAIESEVHQIVQGAPEGTLQKLTPTLRNRSYVQSKVWEGYVGYWAKVHDSAKAREALSHVTNEVVRPKALCTLARELTWEGDLEGAGRLLAEAEEDIGRFKERFDQLRELRNLAQGYAINHQPAMARRVRAKERILAETTDKGGYIPDAFSPSTATIFDYFDPISDWTDLADGLSGSDVVIDLKGTLDQVKTGGKSDSPPSAERMVLWLQQVARNLGICLGLTRELESIDFSEHVAMTRRAADQGNTLAQMNLGYHYAVGKIVKEDSAEAAKWYRKASEQGLTDAQVRLGALYGMGLGVPKSEAEAMRWYKKAADQGDARGNAELAEIYLTDSSPYHNPAKALEYALHAVEADESNAYHLGRLGRAYYETSHFQEALESAQKANSLETNAFMKHEYELRTLIYKRAMELGRKLTDSEEIELLKH